MDSSEVARHYARVLLEVALTEGDDLDALAAGLDAIREAVSSHADLARALTSPAETRARRAALAAGLARCAAPDPVVADRLSRFVSVMVERDRADELETTAREFRAVLDDHNGVVEAEVVSARRLDPAGREALREALAAVLEGRPRLFFREDPSLLGGFAVRSGNRIFDASARGELERFLAAHAAAAR